MPLGLHKLREERFSCGVFYIRGSGTSGGTIHALQGGTTATEEVNLTCLMSRKVVGWFMNRPTMVRYFLQKQDVQC